MTPIPRRSSAIRLRLALAAILSSVLALVGVSPAEALTAKWTTYRGCTINSSDVLQVRTHLAVAGSGYYPDKVQIENGTAGTQTLDAVRVDWYNSAGILLQGRTLTTADFNTPSVVILGGSSTFWTLQSTYKVKVTLYWNSVKMCATAATA